MNVYELFLQMQKITEKSVYFTRLSLKHIAEKGDAGLYILNNIQNIFNQPDHVHLGNFTNRFIISKQIVFSFSEKAHGIILEVTKDKENIIVTGFIAKEAYFKNLKLLWGTTFSPSQQLPKK